MERWLEQTHLIGSKDIYFIMTCGGSIGNAGKYLKSLSSKMKLNYLGCYELVMPENRSVEKTVLTAWPVSAAAQKKRLNTQNTVKAFQDKIYLPKIEKTSCCHERASGGSIFLISIHMSAFVYQAQIDLDNYHCPPIRTYQKRLLHSIFLDDIPKN